jgi:multidrug efflux pump subunit AcrB
LACESTLPIEVSQDVAVLPRDAAMHGSPETPLVVTTKTGATRASVFVPLAFFSGAVGNIYRQFAAVMLTLAGALS